MDNFFGRDSFDFRFRVATGWVLSLGLVVGTAGLMAQEAKTSLVLPPAPLLPAKFGVWELDGAAAAGADGVSLDGATGTVLKEDGLSRSSQQTYRETAGAETGPAETGHGTGHTQTIKVQAFQFEDATGAYSAFTYFRSPEMKGLMANRRIGTEAASTSGGEFLVLSGTTVVKASVSNVRPATSDELRLLATTLPKVGGPKGAAPLLPTLVPAQGLEAGSVRYALGPVSYATQGGVLPAELLGWDKSGEAVTARYASNSGAGGGVLTLLLYPTPQIAGDRGRAIEASINADRAKFGTVKLRREGPMLMLATGGFTAGQEKDLVEGIHLPVQLTWDKKMPLEFHAEVQKTYSLLTSIMVFCGVGALAAIILGLFLGIGRAWIRVLMGKPAASEPEFLRIDLRGRSAPIHLEGQGPGLQR